jgi:hypothetical protein
MGFMIYSLAASLRLESELKASISQHSIFLLHEKSGLNLSIQIYLSYVRAADIIKQFEFSRRLSGAFQVFSKSFSGLHLRKYYILL